MRLATGFFAKFVNISLCDRKDVLDIDLPKDWSAWFFMQTRQVFFCFQDPTHLCTKLRNRMLSKKATMLIGNEVVSIEVLMKLIETKSKLVHGLVKTDIQPKDRQNFKACIKLSNDDVLVALEDVDGSQATRVYLRLLRSVIFAYIEHNTSIIDRIYHSWFAVFLCRIGQTWLQIIDEKDILGYRVETKTNLFITGPALFSIELNAHSLLAVCLLVCQHKLPDSALSISKYSSQPCEATFRLTRSMSGAFSSVVTYDEGESYSSNDESDEELETNVNSSSTSGDDSSEDENDLPCISSSEELENEGTERSTDARGLLLALKESPFIVTIFILHRLLGKIKILSDELKYKAFSVLVTMPLFFCFRLKGFFFISAKSVDFGKAHTLISAVIDQIAALRNEENFSKIFDQINQFCADNNADLNVKVKERRLKTTSTRLKNFLVTSTIGEREIIDCECKYRTSIFYPVIDSIILEKRDRFSTTNMDTLRAVSSLSPESSTFLELTELKALCLMLQCDTSLLKNEIQVFKPMLNQSKSKNITDLFFETLPFQQAFPNIIRLTICSMTIPVSSTTTERTFSKMKLIKTIARNSMSDTRLSDLSLLAIERDIVVDYENIIDAFVAQHKNSRILLK
ncbi:unnamed protein product [Rotaria magnacalcarata]|uniref:HAT C-terminal dimerisation domain-containing protein n=1 Tax=Rotaria magnacalcarata TaxID=392030 RepID=A0A819MVR0_9BILA|nr:unnamed protein product [Rotaria magnacalcarata]